MIIPIRCTSCGKPVAHLWAQYKEAIASGDEPTEVMDKLGLKRYCCRALFLGHIDLLKTVARYKKD
ncbi:MAG: DNA-directed RNA polymerase subunit N [DPANN group archaeon]|nr:DNA-directed RNA polymerase subunit N [DPANN group archaeon]